MKGTGLRNLAALRRETLMLAALVLIALVLAWSLTASGAAQAGPALQDSPLAPGEQLSPLPTPAATVESEPAQPTPTATPTVATPSTPVAAQPPIPIAALAAVMAVIGVAALIIGLRRR